MAYNEYGLTPKQEKFVQLVASGLSQYEAYRQSYSADKMSRNTIDSKASKLMRLDKIRARYESIVNKAINASEEHTVMKTNDLMQRLTDIARASICDVINVTEDEEGNTMIRLKKGCSMHNVKKLTVDSKGNAIVEMIDPNKAMSTLASMLQVADGTGTQEVKVTFHSDMDKYFD